jgi:hypothetical protein
MTFSGMQPDYAIALGPASDNFGGLFQLANGGANSLNFISSVNLSPVGNSNSPTYTFSFNVAQIGMTPNIDGTFRLFATYTSNSGFLDESRRRRRRAQGWNPFIQTGLPPHTIAPERRRWADKWRGPLRRRRRGRQTCRLTQLSPRQTIQPPARISQPAPYRPGRIGPICPPKDRSHRSPPSALFGRTKRMGRRVRRTIHRSTQMISGDAGRRSRCSVRNRWGGDIEAGVGRDFWFVNPPRAEFYAVRQCLGLAGDLVFYLDGGHYRRFNRVAGQQGGKPWPPSAVASTWRSPDAWKTGRRPPSAAG